MTQDPTLVIGATGNVGRQVVAQLAEAGVSVRALARRPSPGLPSGVEYFQGDLAQPASLEPALHRVGAVFLVWPFLTAEHAPAVLDAVSRHARRIVYLSSDGIRDEAERQSDPINQFHTDIEGLIEATAVEWTFLRAGGLAANALQWAAEVRDEGVVRDPYPHAARSLVHEADIAAVAVHALTRDGHAGVRYALTGPAALTTVDQARAIGAAVGRTLRVEVISVPEARAQLIDAGLPADVVDAILEAHAGTEIVSEPVTRTIEEVTGKPARTFQEWAIDHADDFR